MQREAFYDYLHDEVGYGPPTCRSRIGNCSTIEEHEGDLDAAYARDGMGSLMERLQYSKADEREGRPARHSIPINGNVYNGTATLRSAANLYLSFKRGEKRRRNSQGSPHLGQTDSRAPRARSKKTGDWPVWEQPSPEDSLLLARIAGTTGPIRQPGPFRRSMRTETAIGSIMRTTMWRKGGDKWKAFRSR